MNDIRVADLSRDWADEIDARQARVNAKRRVVFRRKSDGAVAIRESMTPHRVMYRRSDDGELMRLSRTAFERMYVEERDYKPLEG